MNSIHPALMRHDQRNALQNINPNPYNNVPSPIRYKPSPLRTAGNQQLKSYGSSSRLSARE
jgi:hypothetical protein